MANTTTSAASHAAETDMAATGGSAPLPVLRGKTKRVYALLEQAVKALGGNKNETTLSLIRDAQRLLQGTAAGKRARSDKPPSAYNLFVKKTMQDLKTENPQLSNKERMTMCATLWRKHKEETKPSAADSTQPGASDK